MFLASAGLFLIWQATRERRLFSAAWRGLTLALALLLIVGVIASAAQLDILSDLFIAVAAAVLTPLWAIMTARQLPSATIDPAAS